MFIIVKSAVAVFSKIFGPVTSFNYVYDPYSFSSNALEIAVKLQYSSYGYITSQDKYQKR